MTRIATLLVLLAVTRTASAQYSEGPYHCSGGPHADEIPPGCDHDGPCANGCWCADACGTSPQQAISPQASAWLLFEALSPVLFFVAPAHTSEAFFQHDGRSPWTSSETAHANWNAFVAKRKELEALGRRRIKDQREHAAHVTRERGALASEEQKQRGLREQAQAKASQLRFVPPKLVPTAIGGFQCDQARVLMPAEHTDAPIAGFSSEGEMLRQCGEYFATPKPAESPCQPTSFACGTEPAMCCPNGYPIFNECDHSCYKDTDFRGAHDEAGMHCQTSRSCAAFQPNP